MKLRHSAVATAILAVVCATSVAQAEGNPAGSNMQNNSGSMQNNSGKSDAQDTNKRLMDPNAPAHTTGSGATTTNSGRAAPDEQDTSRGKGPSTAKPPVGSR